MSIAGLFIIAPNWKEPEAQSNRMAAWDVITLCYLTMGLRQWDTLSQ